MTTAAQPQTAATLRSVDPTTGIQSDPVTQATTPEEVAAIVRSASEAAAAFENLGRSRRAEFLRRISDEFESRRAQILETARFETGLPEARLNGELTRTAYQARFFAEVIEDGTYLELAIDHAGDTPMGPGPDLRRTLVPIGPVAVFGASNFPLAFSVPGGDTISALAAGSPVVVKAHSSHPALSKLTFDALRSAAEATGMPEGTIGIVFGTSAGAELIADPAIKAVGFTGSQGGAQALLAIINERYEPIPFYGELSGLNPIIVSDGALAQRSSEIADGLAASITGSGGQLCTKPGVAFIPAGEAGDSFISQLSQRLQESPATPLLNRRIFDSYRQTTSVLSDLHGVTASATTESTPDEGYHAAAQVFEVAPDAISDEVLEECFGPAAVIIRYADAVELGELFARLPASLTATIHVGSDEAASAADLSEVVKPGAGRIVFDQYPTGVLVSWAQHHGGPWPSTNSLHTSVGATAIRRFLRPVVYQNAPESVLPEELKDGPVDVVRRVDSKLELPSA